ncbi:MAG: DUF86 domain-containing protein [Armatimonadetes bacterium]|nr:DUF86 domain-containing protein [Armatimonadota bacterium]
MRLGIERLFITVGEALSRLSKEEAGLASELPALREIIAFRNILVHGYDVIDDETVWDIAVSKVPDLLERLTTLVQEDER